MTTDETDNDKPKKITSKQIKKKITKHETDLFTPLFTSGLIADYFKLLHGDKFICVNNVLYSYNGIYWEKSGDNNSKLINFFDKIFYSNLITYANDKMSEFNIELLKEQKKRAEDDDEQHNINSIISKLKTNIEQITDLFKNINTLRKGAVRKQIIDDILIFLSNDEIIFDNNPYLFAFKNKVYDLKIGDFVEPNAKFYITQTTNYDYVKSNTEDITELDNFINSIFPNQDIKKDYLTVLATGLCGFQIENLFVATGSGRNGKGVLNGLMMKTVGDYGYNLPSSALLQDIKAGPNPELAGLHNKRFVVSSEPEKGKKIACSTMKKITGDRILPVRTLYSKKCETILLLTYIVECNELLLLDEVNPAVMMRIRMTLFEASFYTQEEINQMDEEMRSLVNEGDPYFKTEEYKDRYKNVLFDLLLPYFKKFQENNYKLAPMPNICSARCKDYFAMSDDIYNWFSEYYEKTNSLEESEPILLTTIYELFKNSEFYGSMNKNDKRTYNRKYFCEKVEKNNFIKKYVREKNSRHNGITISGTSIIGWRRQILEITE